MGVAERISALALAKGARLLERRSLELRVEGLDHVPRRGPLVIAARHFHHLYDGVALLARVPRRLHLVVALDWAATRRQRATMEGLTRLAEWPVLLRAEMLAPGAATSPRPSAYRLDEVRPYYRRARDQAVELVARGSAVVVFPEAYPNVDPHRTLKRDLEEFLPFRAGFARIAELASERLGRGVPILPAGLAYRLRGQRWQAALRFGPALTRAEATSREGLVPLVEEQVAKLSAPV